MTVETLPITRQRVGKTHPLESKGFILDYLAKVRSDYIASMHRAFKAELREISVTNNRCRINGKGRIYGRPYHSPTYHSFEMIVQQLTRAGLIEFSGREEESDNPQFVGWEIKPVRRYYRLATGAGTGTNHP